MKFQPRINPVTLKELRQLVRSRLILWGMVALPIILLAAVAIVLSSEMYDMSPMEAMYGNGLGKNPLVAVSIVTSIVTCGLIPLFTSIKTAIETSRSSLSLEFTTALTPAQIATGKITAAAIISAIAVALAMPFFVLSYLMRGIDLAITVFIPISILVAGVEMAALGLLPACSRRSIAMKIILLILLYLLLPMFTSVVTAGLSMASASIHGGSTEQWTFAGVFATIFMPLAMVAFCRAQAAAMLAPPHTDYLRPLRITQLVLFAAGLLPALMEKGFCILWCVIWTFVAGMIAVCAANNPTPITRGAIVHAPRSLPMRLLAFPLATGSTSSMVFALLLALAVTALVAGSTDAEGMNKFIMAATECGGVVMIACSFALMILDRHRRIANYIGRLSIAYIILVNLLWFLTEVDAIDKSMLQCLPCSLAGIAEFPDAHIGIAAIMGIVAIPFLALMAGKDLEKFRRP